MNAAGRTGIDEEASRRRPKRLQLSRAKGWRKPAGAVTVARPSRWGNPFRISQTWTDVGWNWYVHIGDNIYRDWLSSHVEARNASVELFELHIGPMGDFEFDDETLTELRTALAGHDLACWCPLDGGPCHADVLLRIANQ